MKTSFWIQPILTVLFLGITLLSSGCAAREPRPQPLGPEDVIDMSRAGLSSEEIIEALRESGTVRPLDAETLMEMQDRGVPEDVIAYMQRSSHEGEGAQRPSRAPAGPGLWYGGTPFGWPYVR